jgi:hypothetical protein
VLLLCSTLTSIRAFPKYIAIPDDAGVFSVATVDWFSSQEWGMTRAKRGMNFFELPRTRLRGSDNPSFEVHDRNAPAFNPCSRQKSSDRFPLSFHATARARHVSALAILHNCHGC